ncbi:MAG: threonine synthase [Candidatus Bathyarchaeia archaeon]
MFALKCIGCGAELDADAKAYTCLRCGDLLEVTYDYGEIAARLQRSDWKSRTLNVWKYAEFLPVRDRRNIVTLNEGGTKLHPCTRLSEQVGLPKLYVKNEGENPTASFKDRGMTVGITRAVELGAEIVACASTGNTSASLAAYAAKAGLKCLVLVPAKRIAYGKLAQAMIHGAKVLSVAGNFDEALALVRGLAERDSRVYLLNSINPYRIEGQKTLAFEVCNQLGWKIPSVIVVPVGNAGNISAIWKGFDEFRRLGLVGETPRMIGIQATGAAPIAKAIRDNAQVIGPVKRPETVATAIRIGNPVSWKKALHAIRASEGTTETVNDSEILEAQRMLARREGLFVEPASASSIAGLAKLVGGRVIDRDETAVCVATGHGLKDPQTAVENVEPPIEVRADLSDIQRLVGM